MDRILLALNCKGWSRSVEWSSDISGGDVLDLLFIYLKGLAVWAFTIPLSPVLGSRVYPDGRHRCFVVPHLCHHLGRWADPRLVIFQMHVVSFLSAEPFDEERLREHGCANLLFSVSGLPVGFYSLPWRAFSHEKCASAVCFLTESSDTSQNTS